MIHPLEFAAALARQCLPDCASRRVVAVANSAGPDSTCLLFLLRQLFPPHALLSLHVVHNLQPTSEQMALVAAENARALDIPHHVAHIPWGVPPFPPLPSSGPVERTARDARYHLLFRAITRARVSLLALGHHADDQLETAILRLARGSSLLGAAGMRPLRRWGMGTDSPLASFGHHGLNIFLLRPLLPFPKDRILATCHAHRLRYINDPTNAEPHITPRNTIRHCLASHPPFSCPVSLPPTAPVSFGELNRAFSFLHSIAPNAKQPLYSAVNNLATRAEDVHLKVTSHLAQHALPSPLGTLLLSSTKLCDIIDPDVRGALVFRAIRYVSFHPWGSLRADADRRRSSIDRIVRALWTPDPQASHIKTFTAGGGVLWTPAIFNPTKSLRVGNQCLRSILGPDDRFCWLASRIPPFSKNPQQQGAGSPTKLVVDLTEQLTAATTSSVSPGPLEVLYDCRFLLRIDPLRMPTYVRSALQESNNTASIKVVPFTRYYWPKVVLRRESDPDQILAVPQENGIGPAGPWISIQWIRPLDAT